MVRVASRFASRVASRFAGLLALALLIAVAPRPALSQAQSRTIRVPSRVLGETRIVHVSLPSNYRYAKQRYPVVVLLDGQVRAFYDLTVAAAGYDLVGDMRELAMPAQIIVAVEQGDRSADLTRNATAFSQFLVDELLPYIDREYRTVPYRTLIGHSLGGRFALQQLCQAPQQFSSVVAISPSLSDSLHEAVHDCLVSQWAAQRSAQSPRVRTLTLSAGSREVRATSGVDRLFAFVRDSAPPFFRVQRVDGTGLGHTETPFVTIPAALRFVFDASVWEISSAAADSLMARRGNASRELASALEVVGARVGYRVAPSAKWLGTLTRGFLARGPVDSAIASAKRLVDAFPEDVVSYTLLADAYLMRNDTASARRALTDAIAIADKIEWFDETQREKQKAYLRASLNGLPN